MDDSAILIPESVWNDRRLTWRQKCIVGLCLHEIEHSGKIDYEKCARLCQTAYSTFCNMVSRLIRSGKIPETRMGHIYIMASKSLGLFKIGFSKTPLRRQMQIKREFNDVELLWQSKDIYPPLVEHILHEKFHSKRSFGEWFSLDENDIGFIKEEKI